MKPDSIDWSNIPDFMYFLSKEKFFAFAKKLGGRNTIHYMHIMNWGQKVPGAFIADFPKEDLEKIIQSCLKVYQSDHEKNLKLKNSMYPDLWRKDLMFANCEHPTMYVLCTLFKDNFLKCLFGDLEYQFDVTMGHIASNMRVLRGTFSFPKN